MELKIRKLREGAKIPQRATSGSAGMDLYACIDEPITLAPGQLSIVPTGIAIELPDNGCAAFLYARSGLGVKHGICLSNGVGVIDSDYRGEVCAGLCNVSDKPYVIEPNERVAQMVIAPVFTPDIVEVDELSDTKRGAGGFGSTGSFSKDVGIDLGTANTLVCIRGRGIILREPSVVAIDAREGNVLAVGTPAREMIGRTPSNVSALRPLKDGVIADFEITAKMLQHFLRKAVKTGLFAKPRVVICLPTGVTEVERKAVEDAAYQAGAKPPVTLIEEPMAAAMGAGLPVDEPVGSMVADIGGGTSEVAVISLGGIVSSCSVRVGGDCLDDAIIRHVKQSYSLLIGERTAEDVKIQIGSAFPLGENEEMVVKGRSLSDGLPKDVTLTADEVRDALSPQLEKIIDAIKSTLEQTPPELSADIIDHGITLTGGGALLRGIDMLVAQQTGLTVHIAQKPLDCVADGAGKRLSGNHTPRLRRLSR